MISLTKIQDDKDINDGKLHPIVNLIFDEELRAAISPEDLDVSLIGVKENTIILGYWKRGKHPRKRKIDFFPYYRMETTTPHDQFILQRKDGKSYIFFWKRPEGALVPDPNDILGGTVIEGDLVESFTENTRADFAYRKKLKDDFHIAPWKNIVILAAQFSDCPLPEDILHKDEIPKPPSRPRGRPRKNPEENPAPKKKRGRPKKNDPPVKRGRGRPRKNPEEK